MNEVPTLNDDPTNADIKEWETRDPEIASNTNAQDDLMRTRTERLQHELTIGSSRMTRLPTNKCPSMGRGRQLPRQALNDDDYLVDFDGPEDPRHPFNWKFTTKYAFSSQRI